MESELHSVIELIQAYEHYRQITFLLYIIKDKSSIQGRSIFYDTKGPSYSNETTFPINLLRDLAIESIETTHFFVSDIDVFSSETLYLFRDTLWILDASSEDSPWSEGSIVVEVVPYEWKQNRSRFLLFGGELHLYVASIHITAECRWDQVPRNKTQLLAVYNRTVVQHPTGSSSSKQDTTACRLQ